MDVITFLIDLFVHLDQHLTEIVRNYGSWSYALLGVIIFAETGFVFTPFLPGDSLLFAAGTLAAAAALNVFVLYVLLSGAAILGDTVNYWIGNRFGAYLIHRHSRWLRQEHLDRTHAFFEKYGGKTIVIARFVPIVRTFAPFVAGLGAMSYRRFLAYNVLGGLLWVSVCLGAGYFFGNLPIVREHFSLVVLAIIVISIMPGVYTWYSARLDARRRATAAADPNGPTRE
ncbi:MAG TPA: DedA family protein [Phycisphaerae bacterium]|nr:DedA family protein [Phycisphaerae bacterium]HNU46984.1 DedA family protein [Phycisphaerae bacterium]